MLLCRRNQYFVILNSTSRILSSPRLCTVKYAYYGSAVSEFFLQREGLFNKDIRSLDKWDIKRFPLTTGSCAHVPLKTGFTVHEK